MQLRQLILITASAAPSKYSMKEAEANNYYQIKKVNKFRVVALLSGAIFGCLYATVSRTVTERYFNPTYPLNETEAFLIADDTTVADDLAKKISILCWTYMNKESGAQIKSINSTWGSRCTKIVFLTNYQTNETNVIDIRRGAVNASIESEMIKESFRLIYRNYSDKFDWFLKTEDDTYIVMENLRYLLYAYDPMEPLAFGHLINSSEVKQGYLANGAGYVLSKAALKRLYEGLNSTTKCTYLNGNEALPNDDLHIGKCLEEMRVLAVDSRENKTKERFFNVQLGAFFLPNETRELPFPAYEDYKIDHHLNDSSNYSIAFHKLSANQMHVMEFLVYQIRVYGLPNDTPPLPKKINIKKGTFINS